MDLNIDIGEGGGHDAALMEIATSANIACGGHAGGGVVMADAIAMAKAAGVAIGAHPGYRDPANFGRIETGHPPSAIAAEVSRQLRDFLIAAGHPPHHVKPHGALYHRADADADVARAICEVVQELAPEARIYAFAGGGLAITAGELGMAVCGEGFIDRGYGPDGRLIPRGQPGAIITCPKQAAAQAVDLASRGGVATLCVHGDGPHALDILQAAGHALARIGCLDTRRAIAPVRGELP